MALRCRNMFSTAQLPSCLKQGLPDATHWLLDNNIRGLPSETLHHLDRVKLYAVTGGTVTRACQAPLVSTSTLLTPNQRVQVVHHVPNNLSMALFWTSPPTSLPASRSQTPHGVDPTKLPHFQLPEDRMAEILVRIENVLNIFNTGQALSEFSHSSKWPFREEAYSNPAPDQSSGLDRAVV